MPIFALLGGIFGGLLEMGKTWVTGKVETAKARTEAEVHIQKRRADADVNWEQFMAEGSTNSWKDEWFTILISIPFIMTFMPWTREAAIDGFHALGTIVPQEYWYLMGVAYAAAFGVKGVIEFFKGKTGGGS